MSGWDSCYDNARQGDVKKFDDVKMADIALLDICVPPLQQLVRIMMRVRKMVVARVHYYRGCRRDYNRRCHRRMASSSCPNIFSFSAMFRQHVLNILAR